MRQPTFFNVDSRAKTQLVANHQPKQKLIFTQLDNNPEVLRRAKAPELLVKHSMNLKI